MEISVSNTGNWDFRGSRDLEQTNFLYRNNVDIRGNPRVVFASDGSGGSGSLTVTVVNNTGETIWYLYAKPSSSSDWGQDRLGSSSTLSNGSSLEISLPTAGNWDFRGSRDLGQTNFSYRNNVDVRGNPRVVFTSDGSGGSGGLTVTVVNNTGGTIWYLYAKPSSSSDWGQDRLGSSSTLSNGSSLDITLPNTGNWDFRGSRDLGQTNFAYRNNVSVRGNTRIEFSP
jgi:hypothetical protein